MFVYRKVFHDRSWPAWEDKGGRPIGLGCHQALHLLPWTVVEKHLKRWNLRLFWWNPFVIWMLFRTFSKIGSTFNRNFNWEISFHPNHLHLILNFTFLKYHVTNGNMLLVLDLRVKQRLGARSNSTHTGCFRGEDQQILVALFQLGCCGFMPH